MAKQSELDRLIAQAKRVAEHREQDAEKEIRRMYKKLLKDLQLFLSDTYLKNAKDDVLTYGILQQKGGYAHFLEELTRQADIVTKEEAKLIKQTVTDVYTVCYDGMNSAVGQSVTDEELAERLKGLKGATPQQVKRAVENPVSGLTLDDTLEKHRKDIIWEIRRQVGIGITQGDRYTTMAKRLAEQYDMSYKKAVRITRTETHRAREAGFNDSANETHGRLIGSGLVMAKTWRTMEDGAVRPNGKKKKTGANHVLMEGQTVLQDEDFELYSDGRKSGDKTPAPSQSGIASQDIHCRCYASRDIMTVEEFEALTGRKLDSKYHKQKTSEKAAETVDISEDLSIINNYKSDGLVVFENPNVSQETVAKVQSATKTVLSDFKALEKYSEPILFGDFEDEALGVCSYTSLTGKSQITLSASAFSDEKKLLEILNSHYKSGFSYDTDRIESLVAHELGHNAHIALALKRAGISYGHQLSRLDMFIFDKQYLDISQEIYNVAFNDESLYEIYEQCAVELGKMTVGNSHELIAQSFGSYYFGNAKSKIANKIVKYFIKELK